MRLEPIALYLSQRKLQGTVGEAWRKFRCRGYRRIHVDTMDLPFTDFVNTGCIRRLFQCQDLTQIFIVWPILEDLQGRSHPLRVKSVVIFYHSNCISLIRSPNASI